MRQAHSLLFPLLATALLGASLPVQAEAPSPSPATTARPGQAGPAVLDPAAPTAALQHQPLQAGAAIVSQPGDWKAANAAVAEFPRGHADVLKWEKAQAGAAGQAADPAMPAHDQHPQGGRP